MALLLCARLHSNAGMFALCRLFFARFWLLLLLETLVLDNHLMIYNLPSCFYLLLLLSIKWTLNNLANHPGHPNMHNCSNQCVSQLRFSVSVPVS